MDPGLYQAAIEIPTTIVAAIVTAVLTGGGVSAWIAFRRAPADRESIAVQTMEMVNDELRKQLTSRDQEISMLRERIAILENHAGLRPAD